MFIRRWILLIAIVLTLFAFVAIWHTCGTRHGTRQGLYYSCAPVVPKIGDSSVAELYVVKPGTKPMHRASSDYRSVILRIRCIGVHGRNCEFKVYYVTAGRPDRFAYSVTVDYDTNDLDRRTEVRDSTGHVVLPANSLIDGNPVLFRYFLVFDDRYLEPGKPRLQGIDKRLVRYWKPGNQFSAVRLSIGKQTAHHLELQTQQWRSGDWLWYAIDAPDWEARRRSITKSGNGY